MDREKAIAWLEEAAMYFSRRDTKGEDAAHWANVYNRENARKIADIIRSQKTFGT